ncbi:hypothetical protein HBI78_174470 [Parastagonospora nodorum]|nr:hypothetical protein HBI78_174470 [Parastagonospora nodorum]
MYMLLLCAVLLLFLLEPAAAASPIMGHSMSGLSFEPSFFPDPEHILDSLCQHCAIPFYHCMHSMPHAPYVAARMLYEPQTFCPTLPDVHQIDTDYTALIDYVARVRTQSLMNENVQYINANETTIQPATVQAHIEDIYTPGDRLDKTSSRKAPHRRQAPRPGGYSCRHEGCMKTFDRACELNRHRKTHLGSFERPHQCDICNEGFLYPKDLHRHQKKHIEHTAAKNTFYCQARGCNNFEGFSRRDNLLRHQRRQHPTMVAAT